MLEVKSVHSKKFWHLKKEEWGIDVEILKSLPTTLRVLPDGHLATLVHYLAKRKGEIKPGADIVEWAWHDLHNLPTDCAPNVYKIISHILNNK